MAEQVQSEQQYAFRAQKSLGLVNGEGEYTPISSDSFSYSSVQATARTYKYSPDGRFIAFALANEVVVYQAHPVKLLQTITLPNVVELHFSPRGTYLGTWERPRSAGTGTGAAPAPTQHKNLTVYSTVTGTPLVAFTQKSLGEGTFLQYTEDESLAVRLVGGGEVQVLRPALWAESEANTEVDTTAETGATAPNTVGLVDKVRVEGATTLSLSPGLSNPSIAVFVAEKKGMPASVSLYSLSLSTSAAKIISTTPTLHKSFFKADRCTLKWNGLGTHLLLQTTTDVDNSNKSYYGETLLYLLSSGAGTSLQPEAHKVSLDKPGPVHDFAWSPSSKEFGVVYGFMPAKSSLFSTKLTLLHDFAPSPYNFISFNPQGRLLALAGFGNLAGKVDIFDRRTLRKVSQVKAEGTSVCEWSKDGLRLLTATLSPRLRVDNGIRIWWVGVGTPAPTTPPAGDNTTVGEGSLIHVQETEELYQASWRPFPSLFISTGGGTTQQPAFPATLPPPPPPSPAALAYLLSRPTSKSGVSSLPGSAPGTPGGAGAKPALGGGGGGAYRPPGARGLATPAIFKREDEGGVALHPSAPGSGANTPTTTERERQGRNGIVPGSYGYSQSHQQQNGAGHQGGHQGNHGLARGGRYVPGAPPPPGQQQNQNGSGGAQQGQQGGDGQDGRKVRKRSKGGKKALEGGEGLEGTGAPNGATTPTGGEKGPSPGAGAGAAPGERPPKKERAPRAPKEPREKRDRDRERGGGAKDNSTPSASPPVAPNSAGVPPPPNLDLSSNAPPSAGASLSVQTEDLPPTTPGLESAGGMGLDVVGKKMRNLNKKLKAIEELKEKAKRGERLETTQLKKMEGEAEIRKELAALSPTVGA